jgi:pyruvate dehydrogenase E2 component (dihydrolipoamide acetyltransferase)
MIEEGGDASAFESFTLEDAGGQKEAPKPPKEEASESSEPAGTGSGTAPPPSSAPVPEETESSGGKLQSSLDRYLKAEKEGKKAAPAAGGAATAAAPASTYVDTPTSSMRKTIANRLTESMNQNPHYFVAATVSVTKLLKLRQALNASADGAYKLSVNDFLIKACAVACKKVPTVNSSWRDGFIRQFDNVDISVSHT